MDENEFFYLLGLNFNLYVGHFLDLDLGVLNGMRKIFVKGFSMLKSIFDNWSGKCCKNGHFTK